MNRPIRRGFTLVEVIISIMIGSMILTGVISLWSRVRRDVERSTTRQTLQNDLRTVANSMQNDFRSIRGRPLDLMVANGGETMMIRFEKFAETEDDSFAQDSIEVVQYSLENSILTRTTPLSRKILSTNIDTIVVSLPDSTGVEHDLFQAGREAMLSVEIVGKRRVRGSMEDLYHMERTSIVMRDEYQRATNPSYKSIFDLVKGDFDDIVALDGSQDGFLTPGGALTLESLEGLNDAQLTELLNQQEEMLAQLEESIDALNVDIEDVSNGDSGVKRFWDKVKFWDESEGEKFRKLRDELAEADTVSETETALTKIHAKIDEGNAKYIKKAHKDGEDFDYDGLSSNDKDSYSKALEIRIQMKNMADAPTESNSGESAITSEEMLEALTSDAMFTDSSGNVDRAKQQKVIEYYNKLDKIDEIEDDSDFNSFMATKSLVGYAESKITMLENRDQTQANINLINKVKNG